MELKDSVIDFCDKKYYVVDEFEYKNKKYLYIIEKNLEKTMEVCFLELLDNGNYINVIDVQLLNELNLEETSRTINLKV